eukprot:Rhum_TRINITY_DN8871_c0_g1::Rhum_TRINITY_DN8871_c0_g1_i1::g.30265::m.30265
MPLKEAAAEAAELLRRSDAVLVLAGAGMSADAGVGTFRGAEAGVWDGWRRHRVSELPAAPDGTVGLSQMTDKKWFDEAPSMAWDFWRWCRTGYTEASPHGGYAALLAALRGRRRRLCASGGGGCEEDDDFFVVTTNIDSHFVRAGFAAERVRELHGVVGRVRCSGYGRAAAVAAEEEEAVVKDGAGSKKEDSASEGDEEDEDCGNLRPFDFCEDFTDATDLPHAAGVSCGFVASDAAAVAAAYGDGVSDTDAPPRCACGAVLRPDVTLFGDVQWACAPPPGVHLEQHTRYEAFLESCAGLEATEDGGLRRRRRPDTTGGGGEGAVPPRVVTVLEVGAGTAHTALRRLSRAVLEAGGPVHLVRVNKHEASVSGEEEETPNGGRVVSAPYGAEEFLCALGAAMSS